MVRDLKAIFDRAEEPFLSFCTEYDEWTENFPARTLQSLKECCKTVAKLMIEYYKNLFLEPGGDNFELKKAAFACKLDPMYLKRERN